jgi:polyisoprenoid-binding protein YceI
MKKLIFVFAIGILTAVGCSNGNQQAEPGMDACSCANEELKSEKNAETVKKCGDLRTASPEFEEAFQKCYVAAKAGKDTTQVKLGQMDSLGGFNNLNPAQGGAYAVNADASTIRWVAKKVTATHNGSAKVKSGSFQMANGSLSAGELVIDMASIVDADLDADGKAKLEGHLKSGDFFDVAKFPDAKFVIKTSTMKNKHQFEVVGDLTIKGVTKEVKSTVIVVPNGEKDVNVSGGLAIDRTMFGIKYGSGQFFKDLGDKMIEDRFMVTFDLKATRN